MLEEILPHVERPSRYIGSELNSVRKDLSRVRVKFALAFPDLYEVGMSHLGIQILYQVLNGREEVACERVFAPAPDLERELRKGGLPLLSLESRHPLSAFHILGFSLQYELCFSNVINMLELCGIPLYPSQRTAEHPLIIGGGPIAFNPEAVADYFDCFLLGDGEEGILEVVEQFIRWRERRAPRVDLLHSLSAVEGLYVPSLYRMRGGQGGRIEEIVPLNGASAQVQKRVLPHLGTEGFPWRPVLPYAKVIHSRLNIELSRGCTAGCRFCQAGFVNLPARERSPQATLRAAQEGLKATGWDEVSLLSLSAGDYSRIGELLEVLIGEVGRDRVKVSVPSLRVGSLGRDLVREISRGGATGFTIAPEAGSERLRRVINKNLRDAEIMETVARIFEAGVSAVKLYFMIGLPGETVRDVNAIADLAKGVARLAKGRRLRPRVKVSVGAFVPKAHTPFQWEAMLPLSEVKGRLRLLKRELQGSGVAFSWQDPDVSRLEAIFARGDRRLAPVILRAVELGCRFDGWGERIRHDLWVRAFRECGVDPEPYLGGKDLEERLPWDHLSSGVTKKYLLEELGRSRREEETGDCRYSPCHNCGVCDFDEIYNSIASEGGQITGLSAPRLFGEPRSNGRFRLRFRFAKMGEMRFLSHLETIDLLLRALARASVPIAYSKGLRPRPRISLATGLPVGVESLDEWGDLELDGLMSGEEFEERVKGVLPPGVSVMEVWASPVGGPSLNSRLAGGEYLMAPASWLSGEEVTARAREFLGLKSFPITVKRAGRERTFDLRELVDEIRPGDGGALRFRLKYLNGRTIRPWEALEAIFSLSPREARTLRVVKIKTLFAGTGEARHEGDYGKRDNH